MSEEWQLRKFRYWKNEVPERWLWPTLAAMLPRKLVYYAAIRLISHATTGRYGNQIVPELSAVDALKRWEDECT